MNKRRTNPGISQPSGDKEQGLGWGFGILGEVNCHSQGEMWTLFQGPVSPSEALLTQPSEHIHMATLTQAAIPFCLSCSRDRLTSFLDSVLTSLSLLGRVILFRLTSL